MTELTLAQRAVAYAERGWAVFPLTPGAKEPLPGSNGHKDATRDPAEVAALWVECPDANIGLVPGLSDPPMLVLDFDLKKEGGREDLDKAKEAYGLAGGLIVKTPSGGYHVYLRAPEGAGIAQSNGGTGLGKTVDIRFADGYVLAPGSIVDGKEYKVAGRREFDPLYAEDAPGHLIPVLGEREERDPAAAEWLVEADLPHNVDRAVKFLQSTAPAIEGQGGDSHTYATAEIVRDFGVSEPLALELMAEHYSPRCRPPWPIGELETVVRNAYRYAKRPAGTRARTPEFETRMAEVHMEWLKGRPFPFREISDTEPRPVEWIWDGLLLKGKPNLLYGNGGTNKSRLAVQLAIASRAGLPCLGVPTAKTLPLVVSCEDDADELNRRFKAIGAVLKTDVWDSDIILWPNVGRNTTLARIDDIGGVDYMPFYEDLIAEAGKIAAAGEHPLLILDSLYDFFAGNKIAEAAAHAFIKRVLEPICVRTGATILVIAHPSQAGEDSGRGYAGSVGWNNAIRSRLYVTYNSEQQDYTLTVKKSNYGPPEASLNFRYHEGGLAVVGELERQTQETNERNLIFNCIVRWLEMDGDNRVTRQRNLVAWQLREVQSLLRRPIPNREVKDHLETLVTAGRLEYRSGSSTGPKDDRKAGYFPITPTEKEQP